MSRADRTNPGALRKDGTTGSPLLNRMLPAAIPGALCGEPAYRAQTGRFHRSVAAETNRSNSFHYPGSRRCCCRPACAGTRRRASSIGTPREMASVSRKFLICRMRTASIARIVGGSFDAIVGAEVLVRSVAIILAVGFVVLVRVADEIVERESVVTGDEVDAALRVPCPIRDRGPSSRRSGWRTGPACRRRRARSGAHRRESGRSTQPSGDRRNFPPGRRPPHPRLRRSAWCRAGLGLRRYARAAARRREPGRRVAAQHGCEVETEAIDVHLDDPVT